MSTGHSGPQGKAWSPGSKCSWTWKPVLPVTQIGTGHGAWSLLASGPRLEARGSDGVAHGPARCSESPEFKTCGRDTETCRVCAWRAGGRGGGPCRTLPAGRQQQRQEASPCPERSPSHPCGCRPRLCFCSAPVTHTAPQTGHLCSARVVTQASPRPRHSPGWALRPAPGTPGH